MSILMPAPEFLIDDSGQVLEFEDIHTGGGVKIEYRVRDADISVRLTPQDVECYFKRLHQIKPKSPVVVQGKWDCAAASLSMLLGVRVELVRMAAGRAGWRNDDGGMGFAEEREAARLLGFEIECSRKLPEKDDTPCCVDVPSLNYPGRHHGVYWNGREMLDPNYGRPDRKWYGPEWNPWTIGGSWFTTARRIEPGTRIGKKILYRT